MNFPIPMQNRLRPGRAPAFVSFVPRNLWSTLVLAVFAALVLASSAQADVLVLRAGAGSRGVFGDVARLNERNAAVQPGFRPDNENCQAMWAGADGAIYVSATLLDYGVVYRHAPDGQLLGKIADVRGVQFSAGATARDGSVFLLAQRNAENGVSSREIWRAAADGAQPPQRFVPQGATLEEPTALALAANGDLIVADARAGVMRFDAASGAWRETLAPSDARIGAISALAFGPDGALFLASTQHGSVWRLDAGAAQATEFVAAPRGGLRGVAGLAFGPDGNLYVSDAPTGELRRFDGADGAARGVFARFAPETRPTAIEFVR